ncbi:hypothetical protein DPMN_065828 [Dreissena polymorpha]|uniref:B box-type domain-containing protein n=1 Tax=Dreissena polymorpha TaxID=45954 RepID=A0A9D4BSH1_DREPO|nr:hypothetical protein DPMN_065828 [Dreissena polymorpha]
MATCSSDEVRLSTTELCDPCFSNCKEILAILYCLDCDEKLCEVCGTCHKKSKLSKGHILSRVAEAPPGKIVELLKELTTCPNHQSEEVVNICIDEDQLFCNQCANTRHRKCRQLETIEQNMVTVKPEQTTTHQMSYAPQEKSEVEENHERSSYDSGGSFYNSQVTLTFPQMHQFEKTNRETKVPKNILPQKTINKNTARLKCRKLAEIRHGVLIILMVLIPIRK